VRATVAGLIILAALLMACGSGGRRIVVEPTGFGWEAVVDGLRDPTDFAVAPDGRIFIAERRGAVRVVRDGKLLGEPFIQLAVNAFHERGLLAIALSPSFERDGFLYLYYVAEGDPDDPRGPKTAQLLRVTAGGDVARPGSEFVVLGSVQGEPGRPSCEDFAAGADCIPADGLSHNGGGLAFASDGTLFVSIGDAEQFWPAQDLESYSGKLLRINPNGTAPSDNPFFTSDATDVRSKVWASGLRNPFRLAVQPGTDIPFVGDVGTFFEEIDRGAPGANYGWPCFSADRSATRSSRCEALVETHALPLYSYLREEPGAAIIAGVFYEGRAYPQAYGGALFFGDYIHGTISALDVNADELAVAEVLASAGTPVAFDIGPEGDVYYLSIADGELRRLRYVGLGKGE
jgi:glucose/arabinose dehydrogenase